jgi:hypothetical protein
MNLIQCDEDCVYQRDGYCSLETPAVITNYTGQGCVHQIRVSEKRGQARRPSGKAVSQPPPQRLP